MTLDSKKRKHLGKLIEREFDSKEWRQLGKLTEQELKPLRSLLEGLHALGPLGLSALDSDKLEQFGKLIEREFGSEKWKQIGKLTEKELNSLNSLLVNLPTFSSQWPSFNKQMAKLKNLPAIPPLPGILERERSLYDPKNWDRIFKLLNKEHSPRQTRTGGNNLYFGERAQASKKPDASEAPKDFLSFADLAARWRCSRTTVYRRLRVEGAEVLTFAKRGKRSRKAVARSVVVDIEKRRTKKLS